MDRVQLIVGRGQLVRCGILHDLRGSSKLASKSVWVSIERSLGGRKEKVGLVVNSRGEFAFIPSVRFERFYTLCKFRLISL